MKFNLAYILVFFLVGFSSRSLSKETPIEKTPWFTGSLLATSGTVVQKGHLNIQSFVFTRVLTGIYDQDWRKHAMPHFYSINPSILFRYGLTDWFDLIAIPQVFYNRSRGQSAFAFGDLSLGFEIQFYPPDKSKRIPGIKLRVEEIFPTGPFDEGLPERERADLSGLGAFGTFVNLLFYKVFEPYPSHFLSAKLGFSYIFNSNSHVTGFSTFGGGFGTHGTVFTGNSLFAIVSFEYTLTKNWVLALDNLYVHRDASRFKGDPGITPTGEVATVGFPSSEEVSFAPAIEYNFSENFGIIAGVWFTATGRNTPVFRNGVINFNYTFKASP